MIRIAAARRTRPRRTLSAVAAALVLATVPAAASHSAPLYPTADPDPFYAQPADLSGTQPGDVLAVGPLAMFPDTRITLVRFRSTNSAGDLFAATTTVLQPTSYRRDAPCCPTSTSSMASACAVRCPRCSTPRTRI